MSIRAVIFDIYRTLLEVLPPLPDAEEQWIELWGDFLGGHPALTLRELGIECEKVVARESAAAHAAGISNPEVLWTEVMAGLVPGFAELSAAEQEEFMFFETGLWHAVRLMPGAGETLRFLHGRGVVLGIESNCQPYTLPELRAALDGAGLDTGIFEPALQFLSFENGFSKPDPHVFRMLATRLRLRGIQPHEALVVGDREDNDIEPARAHGFQTWLLTNNGAGENAGGWAALHAHLAGALV
jgi:putative hydrolase of the HAD superfamily